MMGRDGLDGMRSSIGHAIGASLLFGRYADPEHIEYFMGFSGLLAGHSMYLVC
jgi:hypothetical protein